MSSVKILESAARFKLHRFPSPRVAAIDEISGGLRGTPKMIAPKYFYDAYGSELFEQITRTTDYYVTRAEDEILRRYAPVIAATIGTDCVVIEPGSGNCAKIEFLLEALRPSLYVPLDISETPLHAAGLRFGSRYPWLSCMAVAADFSRLQDVAHLLPERRRVVFYPGSTLGNFEPSAALAFLRELRELVGGDGGMLIGIDIHKDEAVLNRAYNDSAGVTAAFNRNILTHVNRVTGSDFMPDAFAHVAFYNHAASRIEMHLESYHTQVVTLAGEKIEFSAGERIHTENSYKYSEQSFAALATEAGLQCRCCWYDSRNLFGLYYLTTASPVAQNNSFENDLSIGNSGSGSEKRNQSASSSQKNFPVTEPDLVIRIEGARRFGPTVQPFRPGSW